MNMAQTKIPSFLTSGADFDGRRVDKERLEASTGKKVLNYLLCLVFKCYGRLWPLL